MSIPFLDLKAQYAQIKDEINQAIQEVIDSCAFASGPFVEKFEKQWAEYCTVKHALGVASGTDALQLILCALGVKQGDEVITVANTFIATAEAISLTGATPVFIDIYETTYTMNPQLLEGAITPRTKAIIPVHLYGQMADMDPIVEIARRHGLSVIEDACQAHGATYKGRKAGSLGDAAAFSFYPGKNLGAYGEAGAVTTASDEIAAKIRMLRDHGQPRKYYHDIIGWNGRMDGIQGAVLSAKLKYLDGWNKARAAIAGVYSRELKHADGVICPHTMDVCGHVFHIYAIRVAERDALLKFLGEQGIQCGIHYPLPLHRQKAYAGSRHGALKVSESCASELLSLPIHADMSVDQAAQVAQALARKTGTRLK